MAAFCAMFAGAAIYGDSKPWEALPTGIYTTIGIAWAIIAPYRYKSKIKAAQAAAERWIAKSGGI